MLNEQTKKKITTVAINPSFYFYFDEQLCDSDTGFKEVKIIPINSLHNFSIYGSTFEQCWNFLHSKYHCTFKYNLYAIPCKPRKIEIFDKLDKCHVWRETDKKPHTFRLDYKYVIRPFMTLDMKDLQRCNPILIMKYITERMDNND